MASVKALEIMTVLAVKEVKIIQISHSSINGDCVGTGVCHDHDL